jgi:hypothetical protein
MRAPSASPALLARKTIAAEAKALKTTPTRSKVVGESRPRPPATARRSSRVATAPAKEAGGTAA